MRLKIKRSQTGFTMIELLVVIVILSLLISISLVTYGKAKQRARLNRIKSNVAEITLALDDYARDHGGLYPAFTDYHNVEPVGADTDPQPPGDPVFGVPQILKRRGNAIIGGGPPLTDTGNPLQDDFYQDLLDPPSNFRVLLSNLDRGPDPNLPRPMNPVDALISGGYLDAYPINPMRGPGIPMVNIAHFLYDYDAGTNDYRFVNINVNGDIRIGLTPALPRPRGLYQPIENIYIDLTYPQGDFAYIPLSLSSEQGTNANGFWIISYGDETTLENSDWTKLSIDPFAGNVRDPRYANWPNLQPPYGDGNPDTPPNPNYGIEFMIKRMAYGALEIRGNIFEDQLKILETN